MLFSTIYPCLLLFTQQEFPLLTTMVTNPRIFDCFLSFFSFCTLLHSYLLFPLTSIYARVPCVADAGGSYRKQRQALENGLIHASSSPHRISMREDSSEMSSRDADSLTPRQQLALQTGLKELQANVDFGSGSQVSWHIHKLLHDTNFPISKINIELAGLCCLDWVRCVEVLPV